MGMLFIIFFFPWCWCNYSCMSCPFCYCILVYIYDIYRYVILYSIYTVYHIYIYMYTHTYVHITLAVRYTAVIWVRRLFRVSTEVKRQRLRPDDWDIEPDKIKSYWSDFSVKKPAQWCKILQLGQTWGDETYSVIYIGFFNHHLFFFAHPAHGPTANTIGGLHTQEEKSR